jgi:peptide/nickel transport system substrate-binding protein
MTLPLIRLFACGLAAASLVTTVSAEPQHGIAMYGQPAQPADFTAFPYVNADAPKGGRIVLGEAGAFDSLNPHIERGRAPYGVRAYVFESLMVRNWDEPFTLYGLLAETVETNPERTWVEFTLRPEARFSDGSPVTPEDVLWSFETLGTQGAGRYRNSWTKIATSEKVGERGVRFTFNDDVNDRELPLIMGLRPILQKAQFEGRDFTESGVDLVPVGSGPYVIGDFEPTRFISLTRNPDYWGANVPAQRGQHNLDEIRYEYFGDGDVAFEAFKGGITTMFREGSAAKWAEQYGFPAVQSGELVQSEIAHQRPTGIWGFVMNTRNPVFQDWRVRQALTHAFNYEFINQTLNGDAQPRITSYFSNSVLGMEAGPAQGRVLELLTPFADDLLPGAMDGYLPPEGDGTERNRGAIRAALDLMEQAGWTVQDGVMADASGAAFTFDILLNQGTTSHQQITDLYVSALDRLGITATVTAIDAAQLRERTNAFDFDMAVYRRSLSLSPGNEQNFYWSAKAADEEGSRNWMGMKSPAAEAMIAAMLSASSHDDFVAATRALDRVLTTGRYVIPFWHSPVSRLAHVKELKKPETTQIYGDWIGFMPDVWWYAE